MSLGIPGNDSPAMVYGTTVGELIDRLKSVPPDTPIRHVPAKSSGISDPVRVKVGTGFVSRYGYVLDPDRGYRPDSEDKVFPVVWL